MSGAVLLPSLYDLMTWTGKSLPCCMELGSVMLVESSGTEYIGGLTSAFTAAFDLPHNKVLA